MKWKILVMALLSILTLSSILGFGETLPWWEKEGAIQRNSLGQHDNWRHYYRGLQQLDAGNFRQAEKEFDYYLNHPEIHRHMFGIAYFGLGLMYQAKGNPELAIDNYKMAIKEDIHPDVKIADKAWLNIGTIYMKKKAYKDAIDAYTKAIEADPKNGLAHYYMGLASLRNGDLETAEKESAEAKKLGVSFTALSDELKKIKNSSLKVIENRINKTDQSIKTNNTTETD